MGRGESTTIGTNMTAKQSCNKNITKCNFKNGSEDFIFVTTLTSEMKTEIERIVCLLNNNSKITLLDVGESGVTIILNKEKMMFLDELNTIRIQNSTVTFEMDLILDCFIDFIGGYESYKLSGCFGSYSENSEVSTRRDCALVLVYSCVNCVKIVTSL